MAKLTPERRAAFLAVLAEGDSVTSACRVIGVARQSIYALRGRDEEFAKDWDDAIEEGTDILEDAARKRAVDGSDTLMIFLLKGRRPNKYRDNAKLEVDVKTDIAAILARRTQRTEVR